MWDVLDEQTAVRNQNSDLFFLRCCSLLSVQLCPLVSQLTFRHQVATCLQFYNDRDAASAAQGPLVDKVEEEGRGVERGSYNGGARRASEARDSTGGCFTDDLGGATRVQG